MSARGSGAWGEALVARYLRERGYRIVASGYRCRFGEIDLIAEHGGRYCFVEVKLRTNTAHGLPREFVHAAKQQRLRSTAQFFISEHDLADAPMRFDVAEVYTDRARSAAATRIEYIENAF